MAPEIITPAAPDASLAEMLAALQGAAFGATARPWNGPELLALIRDSAVGLRLAHAEMERQFVPAGFGLYRVAADEAELLTLAVEPAARRQGLGASLLAACEAGATAAGAARMFLEVAEDNVAARGLYDRAGYRETGRRKAYYLRPGGRRVDALVLRKEL